MRPQGLKPALILGALRGAEASLFYGIARICESAAEASCHWVFPQPL